MTLSILCITNNEYTGTGYFIERMKELSVHLNAELVLGLDREKAQTAPFRHLADVAVDVTANLLQEDVMNSVLDSCSGEWVLRLDDDETVSEALHDWLKSDGYLHAKQRLYAFPRVYLYPDTKHFITNENIYPDLQTRLGLKPLMYGFNFVHAGNPNGTGAVVPYALEHHKLLVRTLGQRREIAARYEQCRPGAGSRPEYARYNLPEDFYHELKTSNYGNGDFSA